MDLALSTVPGLVREKFTKDELLANLSEAMTRHPEIVSDILEIDKRFRGYTSLSELRELAKHDSLTPSLVAIFGPQMKYLNISLEGSNSTAVEVDIACEAILQTVWDALKNLVKKVIEWFQNLVSSLDGLADALEHYSAEMPTLKPVPEDYQKEVLGYDKVGFDKIVSVLSNLAATNSAFSYKRELTVARTLTTKELYHRALDEFRKGYTGLGVIFKETGAETHTIESAYDFEYYNAQLTKHGFHDLSFGRQTGAIVHGLRAFNGLTSKLKQLELDINSNKIEVAATETSATHSLSTDEYSRRYLQIAIRTHLKVIEIYTKIAMRVGRQQLRMLESISK